MQDLSQMSTEELLRMRNAAQQGQPASQPPQSRAPGVIRGPQRVPDPNEEADNSRADRTEARQEASDTWRDLTPDEKAQRGIPQGAVVQINGLGQVKEVVAPPKTRSDADNAMAALRSVGVDLTEQKDRVAEMIAGSTSGRLQSFGANLYSDITGDATEGMENIQRLKTISSDLTLAMTGGSLGNQISNSDRDFIVERMGNVADPNVPADARLAAWNEVKGRMARALNVPEDEVFFFGQTPAQAPEKRDDASAAMLDPTIPPEKSYGDDGEGNPLVVMQNGKLYALAFGRLSDEQPIYVEVGGQYDDIIAADASDLAQRITSMEQSMRERRGEGGFKEVGGRGITLGLSDEAAGIGSALGAALTGDFDVAANFEAGRAVEDLRIQQGRDNMGLAATGLELAGAGGAIRAAGGFAQARQAVRGLQNSGRAVNRASVQGAMRNRATAEGAGIGAVAGVAEGSTLQERGQNALVGAGAGGVLGRLGQNVQNALANRAVTQSGAALPSGAQAQQAADSLGIDLIPAVTGGTTAQRLTSGARQGFISDRPIASAVDRMETQGAAARTRASEMAGDAVDAQDAGELVRRGAQVYSQRTSQIGGNLYDRADRMAGGVKLPLPKATQALDDEIASLQQSPTAGSSSLLRDLQNLRNQISQGQFSIPGIRAMRTDLRQEIVARGLRFSPSDAIYSRVLRAAEDDLIGGLRQAGKDNAANALQTASNFWRRRVETIDEVLDPILGKNAPRSGEQILAAVERLAKPDSGSSVNLGRLMRAMPAGEASAVRATVINRLGRPTAGAAEVDREGFSFATFLTNWNNMSPRARGALFPRESREALDQLATVAQRVKAAGASANTSNTAGAIAVQTALTTSPAWFLDPFMAAGATTSLAGAQYAFGKLLASPRFARLLAGAPRQDNPQARRAFANRLGNLAQSEPTIAREIAAYQRALVANDNVAGSLAAEEQQDIPQ